MSDQATYKVISMTETETDKETDKETAKETIIVIRRYYTMIERLETVQCIDFVNDESHFIDITDINSLKKLRTEIEQSNNVDRVVILNIISL